MQEQLAALREVEENNKVRQTKGSFVQSSAKRWVPGLVNFVPAVAYHFGLNLPAAFTQAVTHLLAEHLEWAARLRKGSRPLICVPERPLPYQFRSWPTFTTSHYSYLLLHLYIRPPLSFFLAPLIHPFVSNGEGGSSIILKTSSCQCQTRQREMHRRLILASNCTEETDVMQWQK